MAYAVDLSNIVLPQCKIWYNDGGADVAVGYTMDDVQISLSPQWHDFKTGQSGTQIVDKRKIGEDCKITFSALETTKTLLTKALPMLTVYTDTGNTYGGGTNTDSLFAKAIKIRLHPINDLSSGADDETYLADDWTFWKCASVGNFSLGFKADVEQVYKMELTAFPDTTKALPMNLYIIGDPANTTLDIVPPTISATVGMYVDKAGPVYTAVVKGTELVDVLTSSRLKFIFSEALNESDALDYKKYVCINETTDVALSLAACTIAYDSATFTVTITTPTFTTAVHYIIGAAGIRDVAGNEMVPDVRRILIA